MDTQAPTHATYRFSALLSAAAVMWRASAPALLLIVLNAAVQAGLMYVNAPSGFSAGFLASFAVSVVSTLALYAVLTAGALESVDGTASFASVMSRTRRNLGPFTVWVALQWALILAISLIHPVLIALVALLTPYLPLVAMDVRGNALAANFRAIGARPGRWLVTSAVLLFAGLVLFLLTVANTLFVKGTPAAAIFWLFIGVVAWWLLTAWALIYRGDRPAADSLPPAAGSALT
jgi:hypothetical protein